jgi:hypothetical protein
MKRGALAAAAVASGVLTVTFSVAAVASWDGFQAQGAKFLLMGLVCAGSIGAFMSAGDPSDNADSESGGDADGGPTWTCAGCGEQNPANFEECWKCQRDRPKQHEPGASPVHQR